MITVTEKLSEQVNDYEFLDSENQKTNFSKLFGPKKDLIVIHNMGNNVLTVRCGRMDSMDCYRI
jgi:predicted dithiol-disulfide oxidoreductase (DUF899 family)